MRSRSSGEANSIVSRPLVLPAVDLDAGVQAVGQLTRDLAGPWMGLTRRPWRSGRGGRLLGVPEGDDLLGGPHRQSLRHDALRQPLLAPLVRQRQQGPRVPGREHPRRHPSLNGRRQPQQADGVGDLWARSLDATGQLLLRAAEVLQHLLVRRRLLQWVELGPVQVLQQGVPQEIVTLGLADDRRDDGQARPAATPATGAPPSPARTDRRPGVGPRWAGAVRPRRSSRRAPPWRPRRRRSGAAESSG